MYNDYLTFEADEVIMYLRKSRSDDPTFTVEEVLARHETILNEWVDKHIGAPIPDHNRYREIVSGETLDARPEVLKVLKQIESPRIKAIIVVEVQRLSRGDLEDAGRLIKLLRYTRTAVITPMKIYDLENEYDRDFFERELKRGNEYLEYSKKILNRGRLLSVSEGNYIGSVPPYGYDKIWVTEGKKRYPTLAINEAEATVVRMIFDMYVNQDMGRVNICNRLNELGVPTKVGGRWSQATIKDLTANIHYIGKVRWNWRKTITVIENGVARDTRPKSKPSEHIVYEGKHPAIISEELFNAAQEKLGRNPRNTSKVKIRNPLAGLVYCQCGRAMTFRTYTKNGITRSAPRLLCDNQTHCKTKSCLYNDIINMITDILKVNIRNFDVQLKNENNVSVSVQEKLIQNLTARVKELERKEISQWEKYAEEGMPKEIFERLNQKVLAEKEQAQLALKKAIDTMPKVELYEERIVRFTDALNAIQDDTVPAATKNKLLKSCIDRITYSRNPEITLDVKLRL